MARDFTLDQVATHNRNHPSNPYLILYGQVFCLGYIPFGGCVVSYDQCKAALSANPDLTRLFMGGHRSERAFNLMMATPHSHMGRLLDPPSDQPAGGQQHQPAQPDHQGHKAPGASPPPPNIPGASPSRASSPRANPPGANAQAGPDAQAQNGNRPNASALSSPAAIVPDDPATLEARRVAEAARKSRLRRAYNPLSPEQYDRDEYPEGAVAMGYLPDRDGRRWREKRMRLARFVQYGHRAAVDEDDLDPSDARHMDINFEREIRSRRHLVGGAARGCTGAFRAARPPPRPSQLRFRDIGAPRGRGPPPPDPPGSDDAGSDGGGDGGGGAADRARPVQVNGRVRPWFPSNSNRTAPAPAAGQPTTAPIVPPAQAPAPPPEQLAQLPLEEQRRLASEKLARDIAAADAVTRARLMTPEAVNKQVESMLASLRNRSNTSRDRGAPQPHHHGPQHRGHEEDRRRQEATEATRRQQQQQQQQQQQRKAEAKKAADDAEANKAASGASKQGDDAERLQHRRNAYNTQECMIDELVLQGKSTKEARDIVRASSVGGIGGILLTDPDGEATSSGRKLVSPEQKPPRSPSSTSGASTTAGTNKRPAADTGRDGQRLKKVRATRITPTGTGSAPSAAPKVTHQGNTKTAPTGGRPRPFEKGKEPWAPGNNAPTQGTGGAADRSDDSEESDGYVSWPGPKLAAVPAPVAGTGTGTTVPPTPAVPSSSTARPQARDPSPYGYNPSAASALLRARGAFRAARGRGYGQGGRGES